MISLNEVNIGGSHPRIAVGLGIRPVEASEQASTLSEEKSVDVLD